MRVMGLAGWSGSGKTTLLIRLIPCLVGRGLRVSTLKHAHHGFDVDQPGKDSFRHREAGATEVMVGSSARFALIHELRGVPEPTLFDLLRRMTPVDLVIVEGYKTAAVPKLEVHRSATGKPLLYPDDDCVVAVAADRPLPGVELPVVALDDIDAIADIVSVEAAPIEPLLARQDTQ